MKVISLPNSITVEIRKIPLKGLAMIAIGLLLTFMCTEYHSVWAQSRNDENGATSQIGSQGEGNPRTTIRPRANEYTVRLNGITWRNRLKWAAQAIVAPERLNDLVSIYVYELDDLCESTTDCVVFSELSTSENSDLRVGVAVSEDETQEIWRAQPLSRQDFDELIEGSSSDGDFPYVVLSIPLARVRAERNLWVSERDWQDGLSRAQSSPLRASR